MSASPIVGGLLIRADANPEIGAGHVMRCIALAQAWKQAGGQPVIVTACSIPFAKQALLAEGLVSVDLKASPGSAEDVALTRTLAHEFGAEWLALDGYHFGPEYRTDLQSGKYRLLLIDDLGSVRADSADLILNQNLHAERSMYTENCADRHLLLGPRYALLRNEFLQEHNKRREISPIAVKVLIAAGGSSAANFLSTFVNAAASSTQRLEVRVIGGGSILSDASRERLLNGSRSSFLFEPSIASMSRPMQWADIAISAAGSTCWEYCALGLPSILIDIAENQRRLGKSLSDCGVAAFIPSREVTADRIRRELESLIFARRRREEMCARGRGLVDANGAYRVANKMRFFGVHMRPARWEDCRLLWDWANDPITRGASFQGEQIPWEEHNSWFREALHKQNSVLLIAEELQKPIAIFRVEARPGNIGEVSVTIAPEMRGRGLAAHIIHECGWEAVHELGLSELHAVIRADNTASRRAFEHAGYDFVEDTLVDGARAVRYVKAEAVNPMSLGDGSIARSHGEYAH